MINLNLALITGIDIPISELQIVIHQPRLSEIALLGENSYFSATQYLCLDKNNILEDNSFLEDLDNFQLLMEVIKKNKEKKKELINLLSILFPQYEPIITDRSILLNEPNSDKIILIDKDNFSYLQDVCKEIFCISSLFQGNNMVYKPANKKAKEIADKIMKARKKIASMKKKDETILDRYISILGTGLKIPYSTLSDLTLYQLFDLMERFELYTAWDIDIRLKLAGGKGERQIDNWMKNIH